VTIVLLIAGCSLFVPRNTDAPPPPATEAPPGLPPDPVPRDTGAAPIDGASLSGSWTAPCELDGYGGDHGFYGGSGGPGNPGGSGGYGAAQSLVVTMDLVEAAGGAIFGGAGFAVSYGYDGGYTFGAGVSGTRDGDDAVALVYRIGKLVAGTFDGTWDRASDELTGTLRFDGYGDTADCVFTRGSGPR